MATDKQLVLIRHGLPKSDPTRSSRDWPLSPKGEEQAQALAVHFSRRRVDQSLFTSDENKALRTAEILARGIGKTVVRQAFLREIDRRPTREMSKEDFAKINIEMFKNPYQPIVGEESSDMARGRFTDGINEILEYQTQNWEGDRLVIAHGTVIALFLAEYNDIDVIRFWARFNCTDYVRISVPDFKIIDTYRASEDKEVKK